MKDLMSALPFVGSRRYSAVHTSRENADSNLSPRAARRKTGSTRSAVTLNRFFTEYSHARKQTTSKSSTPISPTDAHHHPDCFRLANVQNVGRPRMEDVCELKSHRNPCSVMLMLLGLLAIAVGCFIIFIQPYDFLFKWKMVFASGGETFELWRDPPVELFLKVHLFNITNKEAFLAGKEKLRVQEVGPYVYREKMEHANVSFNDNGTLSMVPLHPLEWDGTLSNGSQDDILTLPNIALLSITNVMKDKSYFSKLGLNLLIAQTNSQPLVEMTADEFMFSYKSALLTLGNKFLPSWIYFDRLGLIDRMYDFVGDTATVYTGETNLSLAGLFDTYRGSTDLPQWDGKHCSSISGASDASKFPSLIKPEDELLMFRKSICRPMPMVRTGETVVNGLKGYNYTYKAGVLDNGAKDPRNKCFCRKGKCLQEGLIDVKDCYYGFPIAVSYPHFYEGDPAIIESVEGVQPIKEKHQSTFVIEPESGLPLDIRVRFQINMALDDISSFARVKQFSNMILPMLWTEVGMYQLPKELNDRFMLYLNVLPMVQTVTMYLMFAMGIIFLALSVFRVLCLTLKQQQANTFDSRNNSQIKKDYLQPRHKNSIKTKEMETFYSSLLSPECDDSDSNIVKKQKYMDVV